jgi:predicted DNA-binding transcriptional regulator AlpA
MKFLSRKEILSLTGVSSATIKRWEDDGQFPRRVPLGVVKPVQYKTGKHTNGGRKAYNCRVGWPDDEVAEWVEKRKALRDKAH